MVGSAQTNWGILQHSPDTIAALRGREGKARE